MGEIVGRPGKRRCRRPGPEERRENALRPAAYLGYDRDSLGVHLLARGAYEIAEPQLRRAVWLNPFESVFKQHLAWCLYQQGRHEEAAEWARRSLEQQDDQKTRRILRLAEEKREEERERPERADGEADRDEP